MHISIIMVLTYLVICARTATVPSRYFQLNARYFSADQGVFSKLSMDELIPARWRLPQSIDSDALTPGSYPVFLKPEWGQNAHGIYRADDASQLMKLRALLKQEPQRYLLQEAAPGQREFELFSIDTNRSDDTHDVFSITEAINESEDFPINSKYNRFTRYSHITNQFSVAEQQKIAGYLSEIGQFGISRMSVRANSNEDLVAGNFHVIEINLFLPMPINLLDKTVSMANHWSFIKAAMVSLARATKLIKPEEIEHSIFTRMMLYGRTKSPLKTNPGRSSKMGERRTQS